jgi:hypothetical protein
MGARTPDPLLAKQVLSQLSYRPFTITNVAPHITAGTIIGAHCAD